MAKNFAFEVADCEGVLPRGRERAKRATAPVVLSDGDEEVTTAEATTCGDTTNTLVQRVHTKSQHPKTILRPFRKIPMVQWGRYRESCLPRYRAAQKVDPVLELLPPITLEAIDQCVGKGY